MASRKVTDKLFCWECFEPVGHPYKYTIYPGFYESCGPEGEKLIEFVDKKWKNIPHTGELPLDIVAQAVEHGDKAVAAIDKAESKVTKNRDEFLRLKNDVYCYREFAWFFNTKVRAAEHVLDYQYSKDINDLEKAIPLMEESLNHYRRLVELTKDTYHYANSMQTAQNVFLSVETTEKTRHGRSCYPIMSRN